MFAIGYLFREHLSYLDLKLAVSEVISLNHQSSALWLDLNHQTMKRIKPFWS